MRNPDLIDPEDYRETFLANVRALQAAHSMTNKALAEKSGLKFSTVHAIKDNPHTALRAKYVVAIAGAFGIDPLQFLTKKATIVVNWN